ncbi:cytochrome c biogenesis protein CcdC [Paenactinomyces guangxiensis]|uniref:Cytochrome c biogenesis protein CcdC n=2 Tax=Paenactinomyces guangxiensis TaxID=1490290 RepID=A0A7W1WNQ7_9BACL|nr:cytochrome c biogenesis protein CcdC [Paenactinomyces guangxiensis]MBA4493109.1 cytochrome c biogenesis protein CcdC [Paenactinomyces guangxiensis]MBH8590041.1 cytochrome c biogenesis protein CcdC [Paenactinomyces guangxiensis]
MGHVLPVNMHVLTSLILLLMASLIIFFRLRATKKPTSVKKIILPPLGMSTGFLMFLYPPTHIPLSWAIIAFLAGAVFLSIPLIQTSKFQVIDNQIYLKRSRAFIVILIALLIIRLSLHTYIEQHISIFQTAGLFFILAFGMLLPWRLAMYYQYKQIEKKRLREPVQS